MVTRHDTNEIILGDCIDTLKGFAFKSQWYADEGVPLVKVSDFSDDSISTEDLTFIPEQIAKDFDKYHIRTDDIIIQTVGSWPRNPKSVVGKAIRVPTKCNNALLNQNAVKIIPRANIDGNFLFYLLRSKQFKDYIINTAQGAANQASITLDSIRSFKFFLPDLTTQRKIGQQIRFYDKFINNNAQRIQLLDSMAKLIYDEWFIKFKFPGHEKVKMVDSELGEIPECWQVKKIDDVFEIVLGGTPSRAKAEFWGGNIPWINSGKVNELRIIDESEFITHLGLKKSATKMMPRKTTVLAITGATLGQVSLSEIELCANQSVVGIYDKTQLYSDYIYLKIVELIQDIIMKAGGGAQQHINKEIVCETKIAIPSNEVMNQFNDLIRPINNQIAKLMFRNKNLVATRDLLLPKLISGELDVSELDIKVSEVKA